MNNTSYRKIQVECPVCHKVSAFPIFDSIEITDISEKNSNGKPSIWKRASSGTLFIFKCAQCGYREPMTYKVSCLDNIHELLISVVENKNDENLTSAVFRQMDDDETDVICRMVNNTDELSEKLRLAADGLDDRVFELVRAFVEDDVRQKAYEEDEDFNYENITCWYKGYINEKIYITIKGYGNGPKEMTAAAELYNKLIDVLPDTTGVYKIDREWSAQVVNNYVNNV